MTYKCMFYGGLCWGLNVYLVAYIALVNRLSFKSSTYAAGPGE